MGKDKEIRPSPRPGEQNSADKPSLIDKPNIKKEK
jgi:hypothetical protein